jgi:iron(III) transport system permease protein
VRLGAWRWPALGYCVVVLALGLVVPVVVLAAQAARLGAGPLAAFWIRQAPYLANSLGVAAAGSTAALALGLALALARGRLAGAYPAALVVQAGYAIPGTVLGLALVGALASAAPAVYGTPAALALAYVVLFTTPALQACQAAVAQVTPALEAAARGLGSTPLDAVRRVVLPLAGPGVGAGWALVFALSVRELAASIVLRPAGFDTLAIRIWVHTMDVGPDPRAAAVALLLLMVVAAVWLAALAIGRPRAGEARG